ncbi:MAG: alpha-amylase family glycosyl hydrolase [Bacteroidota bacterium]
MKKLQILLFLISITHLTFSQIVSINPSSAGADDNATLIFDATQGNGELVGASKVYLHHGAVTDAPDGTAWSYVVGNWGQDDGVGEMTQVPGEDNKWQIEFAPTIRAHFGAPTNVDIFRLSLVFRSADGNTKGTIAAGDYSWGTVASNLDIYLNLDAGNFVSINQPQGDGDFFENGEPFTIAGSASGEVSEMKIWIDEGNGFEEKSSVSAGTDISYTYVPSASGSITIKITATINGQMVEDEKDYNVTIQQATEIVDLPAGLKAGINYDDSDATKATLVLQAPGKEFVYVVGDFNDWTPLENYQMKKTPDGQYFWLELSDLTPQQQYVFQYWIDGNDIKVGDPYAEQVADPWNDQWIDEVTFPNIPDYDKTAYHMATVLQTGQTPFVWDPSEDDWERPNVDDIVIYELLVRDFIGTHSWKDLEDTLAYIKNLGVDAIELMPFNEFEGNESWGYNPAYYLAPDKYYGTKDDLKHFIQTCHQQGLAVIMDMVLNHAFGQNPMVKMYFNESEGRPTADNPWFNEFYVGPFEWGYDFNHESQYTKDFMDRVNKFWIEEYHVDGYRFDFTKGMTNYAPGGNIDGYDISRINILKRMADEIWAVDDEAYIILEHWGPANEEGELADYGMRMWRNRSYDYVPAVNGTGSGSFGNMNANSHVSYHNSHDERRIAEHALSEGLSNGGYDVRNPLIMYERVKMAAAFTFLFPGPKMLWQFDELGYDIHIDFNGRTGNKPLPWGPNGLGYYEDPLRQHIYDAYKGILHVRKSIGPDTLSWAAANHKLNETVRRISYNTVGIDMVVIGNFGLDTESINPEFAQTGWWYDYFSGDSINVTDTGEMIELRAGQWHLFTSEKLSDGMPGVVATYDNPVTITPYPFTKSTEITVRFDAAKAFPNGTAGLVGADKVYFHSGVILDDPSSTTLENVVGNLTDDGVGQMTQVGTDLWEITLTPKDYYGLADSEEPFKIGMWFRDENNVNRGFGFRDGVIFFDVDSDRPFITIEPQGFDIEDEITITFNAKKGNGELIGADKIYIHSSIDITDTNTPQNSAWNYVTGNWGQDDGIGAMTEVANQPDIWEITLTPKDYYNLPNGSTAYWLAAVFRSPDGNVKGTGNPGPLPNGFIHTNQDFFIENDFTINTTDVDGKNIQAAIYPNPTQLNQVQIWMNGMEGNVQMELYDLRGQLLKTELVNVFGEYTHTFDLNNVGQGMYMIRMVGDGFVVTKQLVRK